MAAIDEKKKCDENIEWKVITCMTEPTDDDTQIIYQFKITAQINGNRVSKSSDFLTVECEDHITFKEKLETAQVYEINNSQYQVTVFNKTFTCQKIEKGNK